MTLRLGDTAPNFEQESSEGQINFYDYLGDHWGILFSHPADYTLFVPPNWDTPPNSKMNLKNAT